MIMVMSLVEDCVDLSPINGLLHDDLYPMPSIREVLAKHHGPLSRRNHIDCTAAYHRFSKISIRNFDRKSFAISSSVTLEDL
jgi:hypothetical protein